jgi:hypothetical protein
LIGLIRRVVGVGDRGIKVPAYVVGLPEAGGSKREEGDEEGGEAKPLKEGGERMADGGRSFKHFRISGGAGGGGGFQGIHGFFAFLWIQWFRFFAVCPAGALPELGFRPAGMCPAEGSSGP